MNKNLFLKLLIGIFLLLFVVLFFEGSSLNAQNCIDNYQCGPGQYCRKQVGDCFGWGVCSDIPGICYGGYGLMPTPVCGCNGITYYGSCEASSAGVNVAYSGECRTSSSPWTNPNWQDWWSYPYWQWQDWWSYPYWPWQDWSSYPYWQWQDWWSYPYWQWQNWPYPNWQNSYYSYW